MHSFLKAVGFSKVTKREEMKEIILTSEAYVALGLKSNEADGKSISAAIMELQARVEKAEKELEDQRKLKANPPWRQFLRKNRWVQR